MKKMVLSLVAAMAIALIATACSSGQECPAYSQAATNAEALA